MSDLRQRAHGDDGRRGIWFHRYELMRVDESHESARELLLNIERPEPCRGPHEAPVLHQGRRRRDGTTLLQRETPGNRGRLPGSAAATGSTPASWPPSAPSTSRKSTGRSGSEILLRPLRPQARRRARPEQEQLASPANSPTRSAFSARAATSPASRSGEPSGWSAQVYFVAPRRGRTPGRTCHLAKPLVEQDLTSTGRQEAELLTG